MQRTATIAALLACVGLVFVPQFVSSARADDSPLFVIGQGAEVPAGTRVDAAVVIGGSLVVAGTVEGPAVAVGGDLRIAPNAKVGGPAAAVGGALLVDPAAEVVGPKVQVAGGDFSQVAADLSNADGGEYQAPPMWAGPILRMFQVLALFVVGIFLLLLAPRPVRVVGRTLRERPAQASLAGLVLLLGFIPLCIVLAISLIGIPLIPLAVLGLLALFIMGLSAMCLDVGFKLPFVKGEDNLFGALTGGMLALMLAVMVPVLGGLLLFFASFYAAGGVLISRFGTRPPPAAESAAGHESQAHAHAEG